MQISKIFAASPGRTLVFALGFLIFLGTILISLPYALVQPGSLSLLDRIFTVVSAVSVTGLMTIPLQQFTLFGQVVLLALIQIGGLGLITLTVFLMSLFIQVGLGTHLMAG